MFVNVGKAGSDVTAMAEALGRLISLTFRMASPIPPIERAHKIAAELIGIGGARSLGFGENRVRSLPDAVAKVMDRHFGFFTKHRLDASANGNGLSAMAKNSNGAGAANGERSEQIAENGKEEPGGAVNQTVVVQPALIAETNPTPRERLVTVDLCPSCGEGSLVFEESCKKCYSCGYSEC
jgi:ribonucleoside-diphosphate reductase alpha chain